MTTASVARFDLYRNIHKALRATKCDALTALARMDAQDDAERTLTLSQVRDLLAFCHNHLAKEEKYVHPAMEARAPGSAQRAASEHLAHQRSLVALEGNSAELERATGTARAAAAASLHRHFALFVGENLVHMHAEQCENNEVL